MLNRYRSFILQNIRAELFSINEDTLYASSEFLMRLKKLSKSKGKVGDIANYLISVIESEVNFDELNYNYIDATDKSDMISFLPKNKVDYTKSTSDLFKTTGRNEIKIGRFIRSMIELIKDRDYEDDVPNFKDKDYEDFVNAFKALKIDTSREFKLFSGDDIHKIYKSKNNYAVYGSLGNSCMADEEKDIFNIYIKNKKKVRLLALVDKKERVHGRALLWRLDKSPCDAKYFLDRVYSISDSDIVRFQNFAEEKGFLYKKYNTSYDEENVQFRYKGEDIFGEIIVKLEVGSFDKYPFVDTLQYLDHAKTQLSNLPSFGCYQLHSVWGGCKHCDVCKGSLRPRKRGLSNRGTTGLCLVCCDGLSKLMALGIDTGLENRLKN